MIDMNKLIDHPITIEKLVDDNGNWMVAYVYCNWGLDHVLMLLPRLDPDPNSEESRINADVMNVPDGVQEEAYMVNQWNQKHGETPFLVTVPGPTTLKACVAEMERRLEGYHGDWEKFFNDAAEFDKWRKVAHYVANTEGAEYTAWNRGWESLLDKI